MTPKEKAIELADIYFEIVKDIDWRKNNSPPMFMAHVKKCALAAVNEIINSNKNQTIHFMPCNSSDCGCVTYWEQVKYEIEKL